MSQQYRIIGYRDNGVCVDCGKVTTTYLLLNIGESVLRKDGEEIITKIEKCIDCLDGDLMTDDVRGEINKRYSGIHYLDSADYFRKKSRRIMIAHYILTFLLFYYLIKTNHYILMAVCGAAYIFYAREVHSIRKYLKSLVQEIMR